MKHVTFDLSEFERELNRIEGVAEQALQITADTVTEDILQKTAKGKDADNKPFKEYVPPYARKREKAGLQRKPPNLRVTGELLDGTRLVGDELLPPEGFEKIAQGNYRWRAYFAVGTDTVTKVVNRLISRFSGS